MPNFAHPKHKGPIIIKSSDYLTIHPQAKNRYVNPYNSYPPIRM